MTLPWHLVAKHIHPHAQFRQKLQQKIRKLEAHLQHFPADAVHLQVNVDRHPKNGRFTLGLTLRLPSGVLRSEQSAADPIPALDRAVKALLREVDSLKSALRHESDWKRLSRRQSAAAAKALRSRASLAKSGREALKQGDQLRLLLSEQYGPLLYHVRRQIWRAETQGAIPRHAIDPEAVADEVVRQAFVSYASKPPDQGERLWLYSLARLELERRFRDLQDRAVRSVPLDDTALQGLEQQIGADGAGEPVSILEQLSEPDGVQVRDVTADAHIVSPDVAAAENDLVEYLQHLTRDWPLPEHEVFELHFLEGFEPDEVAMLQKMKVSEVQKVITDVQGRLRELLTEAAQTKAAQERISFSARQQLRVDKAPKQYK